MAGFSESSVGKESACNAGDPGSFPGLRRSPGGSDSKESTCNVGDLGSVPGLGRSPGEGMATQYSGLENPHGQRSLASYSPGGRKESDKSNYTQQPRTRCTRWSRGIQKCLRGSRGRPQHLACFPQGPCLTRTLFSTADIYALHGGWHQQWFRVSNNFPFVMRRVWPFDQRAFKFLLPSPLSSPPSPRLPHPRLDPNWLLSLSFSLTQETLNVPCLPLDPPSFPELTYAHECLI